MDPSEQVKISIIIPVLNEEKYIAKCLESLVAQQYPKEIVEIIVIDNGSTDNSVQIAREYATHVLEEPNLNVAQMRNRGVEIATGDVLAFIDSDCVAAKDWLQEGLNSLDKEECITGHFHGIPEDAGWLERAWFCQSLGGRCKVSHINTSNLFVRKELFDKLNGFNENLVTGEDSEFCVRASEYVDVVSDDKIDVIHLANPTTLSEFFRREQWHGLGALGSFRKDKKDKPFLATVVFAISTLAQIVGLGILILSGDFSLLLASTVVVVSLILATLFIRKQYIVNAVHAAQLGVLYYVYFCARSLSLVNLMFKRQNYWKS